MRPRSRQNITRRGSLSVIQPKRTTLHNDTHEPPPPSIAAQLQSAQRGHSLSTVSLGGSVPPAQLVAESVVAPQPGGSGAAGTAAHNQTGLSDGLKAGVETLSGVSLDSVRVHYNSERPAELGALAYAQGTDIHVGPGQEQYLPHEAWHVVQQMQGRVQPTIQAKGVDINDNAGLEHEADTMGARASELGRAIAAEYIAAPSAYAPPAARAAPVVQRAKLNIRAKDGTISGVSNFPGRPASNLRSGQGQHLTAYVTFEQTILSNVRDLTPKQAAQRLIEVIQEFKTLPKMENVGNWNKHIHNAFDQQIDILTDSITNEDDKGTTNTIGLLIDNILAARNQVPDTAISEHGTVGHGEAKYAGILEELETHLRKGAWKDDWDEETVAQQSLGSMWSLFDYDPPEPDNDDKLKTIEDRVLTHIMSVRRAFPHTFDWLTGKGSKYWLMTFLINNQGTVGVPLPRINAGTLKKIMEDVHGRL